MRKKYARTMLLLVLVSLFCGCSKKTVETKEIPLLEPVETVTDVEPVLYRDLYEMTTKDGEYSPYTVELKFLEAGNISGMFVCLGSEVEKGDLLAEMDESKYMYAESNAAGRYWQSKQDALTKQAQYKKLLEKATDKDEIAWYKLLIRQAGETFELMEPQLQKEWDEARGKLGRNCIFAPFDGIVTGCMANGDHLESGQGALALSDLSRGYVVTDGYLSPSDFDKIDEAYVWVNGEKRELFYEKELQDEDNAYTLLSVKDSTGLEFGDFVVVCLKKNLHTHVLSVPLQTVSHELGKDYVYVSENGSWVRREIKVGYKNGLFAEVLEGLQEGEQVYAKK